MSDHFPADLHTTVVQQFQAQAEKTPAAIALVHGRQQLSYGELNRRANRLAHFLMKEGVGPETPVALCLERSPELLVGILAILKAGGAYLPLDPALPAARLTAMLEDAAPRLLLTQASLLEKLSAPGLPTLALDAQWPAIAGERSENPPLRARPGHLAYIIYTSGSSGKPKGVMIEHAALSNFTEVISAEYEIAPGDRVLQFASISFDASVEEIFPCLTRGATLVLRSEEMVGTVATFLQHCGEMGLTVLDLPTSYWHQLTSELAHTEPSFPDSLRLLIIGGEKAQPALLAEWFNWAPPSIRLVNSYGPTEATVVATIYELSRATAPAAMEPVPIGRPIGNVEAYVLDEQLQPAPIGAAGELHLGGAALARGYLHRPRLTAEKFIANPFSNGAGGRLYKTGDLVRRLPDGNLVFLGRVDNQVKIRGFRIEMGEIEAALAQHEAVAGVVVLAREDGAYRRQLVAYVTLKQGPPPKIDELRSFLGQTLPGYMLPSAFVVLQSFPLNSSGKIDREALPVPELDRAGLSGPLVPPRTASEATLARIWREALRLPAVGIHDNFFDLGGDSILSIQIAAAANQAGLALTPEQLFRHPTIAGLAGAAGERSLARQPVNKAEQGILTGALPLTPPQRQLLEDAAAPQHYVQSLLLELAQPVEAALLEQAVRRLLLHHDVLRLRFERSGSGWRQVMAAPAEPVPFFSSDISRLPAAAQQAAVQAAAKRLQGSLDLAEGPLLQAALFQRGEQRPGLLLLVVHQLAADAISWGILLEQLDGLYRQLRRQEPAQLPAKTTSYRYWAERLAEYARSAALRRELPYWLALQDDQAAARPLERAAAGTASGAVTTGLSVTQTQALLSAIARAYNAQVAEALLTALAQTFTGWTGQPALLLDVEGPGRPALFEEVDLSRTAGSFAAIYPLRLSLDGQSGPGEALMAVKEQVRAVPNGGVGYGLLRYLSADEAIRRDLQALPQAEVSFHYLGQLDHLLPPGSPFAFAPDLGAGARNGMPPGVRHPRHRLAITAAISQGALALTWDYDDSLQPATVERLAARHVDALEKLIAHCQAPTAGAYTPSDFPEADLNQEELDHLLAEIDALEG